MDFNRSPMFKTKTTVHIINIYIKSIQDRCLEDTTIFISIHCICTHNQQNKGLINNDMIYWMFDGDTQVHDWKRSTIFCY